ncbi:hypothetical protein G5C51_30065 [Streptomyces sp. A7024]|uniref:Uncharacterized protein n=1 Tax=Streptomyces coryli TaxID=1128680 RepID=A0A6G4U7P9_9ACTN|nr:hypothetical protein [Streptomyces coryli]NGN68133.1 hypothetical protein [Streptomyces coryli]
MDYHDVVDELETAELRLGLAAADPDESEAEADAQGMREAAARGEYGIAGWLLSIAR